jgi:hypothetical protein
MTAHHATPYGAVTIFPDSVVLEAHSGQLYAWARRPGNAWPLSELEDFEYVTAQFDSSGLVELEADRDTVDIPGDELTAWSSDVLRSVLPADHPAHFVTVGQFEG